jgi:uncharacterized protein YbjT (DUF2867 family)
MNNLILVLGATGQQGGAVARQLLAHGFGVRALTRDSTSAAAQQLRQAGVDLVTGDMGDEATLAAAMRGVYGVFSVQPPAWAPTPESDAEEARIGQLVVRVAQRSGVQHLVYSSVLGSELQVAFRPAFKYAIEEYLWQSGVPATVLKPAVFMENAYLPQFSLPAASIYNATPFELPTPYIAVEDIGVFARLAFERPQQFVGQSLNLAGDELTVTALAELLTRELGAPIHAVQVPLDVVKAQNDLLGQFVEAIYTHGIPAVDLLALRRLHPKLRTFAEWVASAPVKARLRQLLPAAPNLAVAAG